VPQIHKGQILGVIEAINKTGGEFDENDLSLANAVAASAATAIENARLFEAERAQFQRWQELQIRLAQIEKIAALGRLVASVAHEINNPLQAVVGSLGLAYEAMAGSACPEQLQRYLEIARQECRRIAIIVQRVDNLAHMEHGELRPTNLITLLNGTLELLGSRLQDNHVHVERMVVEPLPLIWANSDLVQQVFMNLALNAAEAMAQHGGTLCVRMASDRMPADEGQDVPAVRIEFGDTGIGMPPEVLAHLFEPLYTTDPKRAGLGLSTSYEIVRAHHGQITATSEPGVGTTFSILLPVEL
jgi:two-component system NtrC family sensor kinase